MKVSLTDAGKRFNRDWIFRHVSYKFEKNKAYAITGPNGSGKSTLLQVLSGSMQVSEGTITWSLTDKQVLPDDVYKNVSFCGPYLEVVEEMTLKEFLEFHSHFKPLIPSVSINSIAAMLNLNDAIDKQIRYYSSGMKQRVKLAQAIFTRTDFLFLDEPCTNLDASGIELYHQLVNDYGRERLIVVSSNDEVEYRFCKEKISILDYKS